MIDVFIHIWNGRFYGFVPRRAIWFGGPSKSRIAEIRAEYW